MAFPTVTAPTTTAISSALSTMNVNIPGSLSDGDLLLAAVEVQNSGTWTMPVGWVQLTNQAGGSNTGQLTTFYKIATGTEGSTEAFVLSTTSTAVWQVRKIVNHDVKSLLANGSMEDTGGWIAGGTTANVTLKSSDFARSGSFSLKVVEVNGNCYAYQDVAVTPGQRIKLSGYIYLSARSAGSLWIKITNTSFAAKAQSSLVSTTGTWQYVSCEHTVEAGVTTIRIVLDSANTANLTGYFDDMRLDVNIQGGSASGDSSAANPPSLSPSWGSDDNLWIALAGHAASSDNAFSAAPTNYTGFVNTGTSSGGSAASIGSGTRNLTASSEDPGTFSVNNNRWWAATTVAIRPSAVVGSSSKYWNGTAWVPGPVKVYNGTSFVDATVKRYNGSSWVAI